MVFALPQKSENTPPRTAQFVIRFTPEELQTLHQMARNQGFSSTGEFVREVLQQAQII